MAAPTETSTARQGHAVGVWRIDSVRLFDAPALSADLLARGRRVGVASSVRNDV